MKKIRRVMSGFSYLTLILSLALMTCIVAGTVQGATVYVDDATGDDATGERGNTGKPFKTIQAGINAALSGDTVQLANGLWTGAGNTNLVIDKDLSLVSGSGNADDCVIDGSGSARILTVTPGVFVGMDGIKYMNGNAPGGYPAGVGGGILNDGAYLYITNSRFERCEASVAGGAIGAFDGYTSVIDSRFKNNAAPVDSGWGGAADIEGGSCLFDHNIFEGNTARDAACIFVGWSNDPLYPATIKRNFFTRNNAADAGIIYARECPLVNINGNAFVCNTGGSCAGVWGNNSYIVCKQNTFYANTCDPGGLSGSLVISDGGSADCCNNFSEYNDPRAFYGHPGTTYFIQANGYGSWGGEPYEIVVGNPTVIDYGGNSTTETGVYSSSLCSQDILVPEDFIPPLGSFPCGAGVTYEGMLAESFFDVFFAVDSPAIGWTECAGQAPEPTADLAVTKEATNTNPKPGEVFQYIIRVTNNGPDTAYGVKVTEPATNSQFFPYAFAYISHNEDQGFFDLGEHEWDVGILHRDESATLEITVSVPAELSGGGAYPNTAEVSGSVDDPKPENNSATATVEVYKPGADLSITKEATNTNPKAGEVFQYIIKVTNNGPDTAYGVKVTEGTDFLHLWSGFFEYISHNEDQGSFNLDTDEWDIGILHKGESASLEITVSVASGLPAGGYINKVKVSGSVDDPNPDNNSASVTITVAKPVADLSIIKEANNTNPKPGETFQYIIKVTNNGPDTIYDAIVSELAYFRYPFPYPFEYVSHNEDQGLFDLDTRKWDIDVLHRDRSASLEITVRVPYEQLVGEVISNTAKVSGNVDDPNPDNNSSTATVTVSKPISEFLVLTKEVSDPRPKEGDTITYTIYVSNHGIDTTGVQVADNLPADISYVSHSVWRWRTATSDYIQLDVSYDPAFGVFDLVDMPWGQFAYMTKVKINEGTAGKTITNTAKAAGDNFDPDYPGNKNEGSVSITVQGADVKVGCSVDKVSGTQSSSIVAAQVILNSGPDALSVNEGDTIAYTVEVTNDGPDLAVVEITDQLFPGVTCVSSEPEGDYDAANRTVRWNLGSLGKDDTTTLTITATVDSGTGGTTITNVASVTDMDQGDPDESNNSDAADIRVQLADLEVTKTVSNPSPRVGTDITYTVQVTNHGPDPATGIEIIDQLPAGVTYVSDTPDQGNYSEGVWSAGSLADDASAVLIITATVDQGTAGATITNTASVPAADQADHNNGNNTDSATITPILLKLLSASYEVCETLLTLTFSDAIDPDLTYFDWIDMEIDDSGNLDFGLSSDPGQCLQAVPGTPYEVDGEMRYPVEIDMLCAVPATINLAIAAFVTCKSDDIDLILQPGAFTDGYGNPNEPADVLLEITACGMDLRTRGDVTGDGNITAYDAAFVLRCIVEGRTSLPIYPAATEVCDQLAAWGQECDIIRYLADTDDSGDISSFDATRILRFSAGIIDGFSSESCAPVNVTGRRNGYLQVSSCDEQRLEVSIDLDDVRDVYSAGVTMTYDPQMMTVTDVSGTPAISGWLSEYGTTAPGQLKISLAGASAPVQSGSLITVSFDVVSADAVRQLDVTEFELNGGRMNATIQNLPKTFALLQNYPNPFNPETWIPYQLAKPADVTITIYNLAGQMVRKLELGNMVPGNYVDRSKAVYWDGRNAWGERVSSGIYFYQLQAGRDASVKKMIIVK